MKTTIALTAVAALAAKASAACFSEPMGYPCCKGNDVAYTDGDGKWGVENGDWCGIADTPSSASCWSTNLGYPCCSSASAEVFYTDDDGKWGVENGDWCGIPTNGGNTPSNPITGGGSTTPGEQYTISGNPFANVEFYINPYYVEEVEDNIKNMQSWLEPNLKNALSQQTGSKKVLTVFVVYDLPGRDCHALASNGELLANESDMQRYKTEYIDVIEKHLQTYKSQPVVLIIEPDSLANMVTNIETTPACAASQDYYYGGHAYLLKKFGVLPHVAMYLDIGHAFWLGWDDNREKAGQVYKKVIQSGSPV
eukprot:jgi/Orpsp1_1/1177481/evm.model.c7180000061604.1